METKSKLATAATTITAVATGIGLARDAKAKWDERSLYTATINENSYVYKTLLIWLNQQSNQRRIKFVSRENGLARFYDGTGNQNVNINGHSLSVSIERPEATTRNRDGDYGSNSYFSENLIFKSRTRAGILALESLLIDLTEQTKLAERQIYIYSAASWGWSSSDFIYRNLDSVFLPQGVKESIIDDIETFLGNEDRYSHIGIPWHRGYLLHGEPGNGKSSLVAAIAHAYRLNLYNLQLSGVDDDRKLSELIGSMQSNSVLLLEDIDIFSKTMKREQADTGPTLAGLLNALDGVNTPHGMLTFITTNRKSVLEDALIRPGRIDFTLELQPPVRYQVDTMFEHVYGESLGVEPRGFKSMAELSEIFKRNTTDAESARLEIKK